MRSPVVRRALSLAATALILSTTAVYADSIDPDGDTANPGGNVTYQDPSPNQQDCAARGTGVTGKIIVTRSNSGDHFTAGEAVTVAFTTPTGISATFTPRTVPTGTAWDSNGDSFEIAISTVTATSVGHGAYSVGVLVTGATSNYSPNAKNYSVTVDTTCVVDPGTVDSDGDGVADDDDNCPSVANPGQEDADGDGAGNACESNSYAPAVLTAAANASGNEGSTLTTSGAFSDQDGNSSLTVTKVSGDGSVTDNGDGTWSWSLPTIDNGSGSVVVQASDGEHTAATDSFDWSAVNVAPTLSALSLSGASGTACIGGNNVGLDFNWADPGSADTFTGSINWGDGSTNGTFTTSPVSTSHSYAAGNYTITVTVTDDDNGSDSDTGSVSLLYNVSGVLQPVNDTQAKNDPSIFKYGNTIPVKITVTDCDGTPVSGLSPQVSVKKTFGSTPATGTDEVITSTSGADSGTTMRWSDPLYIYNLATKSLADSTATYQITITGPFQTVTTLFGTRAK